MIKTKHIAHALELYKYGSIRKAAKAANLSQPAFSRSVAALEDDLGAQLFERHSSGVVATDFGELFLRRGEQILLEVVDLRREIELMKEGGLGEFSLAMGPYPAEISAHRAIGRMMNDSPALECRLNVCDWREVSRRVLDRQADIGIAEIIKIEGDEQLHKETLGTHTLFFFCRPEHPLVENKRVTREALRPFPTVTIRLPRRMDSVFPGKITHDRATGDLMPTVVVEDIGSARQIITECDGIFPATMIQAQHELTSGALKVLKFQEPWMKLNYGFIYLKERTLTPVSKKFIQYERQVEAEVVKVNQELEKEFFGS